MSDPAAFPAVGSPLVDKNGRINQAWLQLLIALWNRTGGGMGTSTTASQDSFWTGLAGGSSNDIVLSLSPAPAAYQPGQRFIFKAAFDNTGPTVAVVDGLIAMQVLKANSQLLQGQEILTGHYYELIVTGDQFELSEFMPQSPHEVLDQLLTVDGTGSGLDADLLDGLHADELITNDILASQVFGH